MLFRPIDLASGLALFSLALAPACSGGGDGSGDGSGAADAGDSQGAPDAGDVLGDFASLISGDWEVPAGEEVYKCVRLTLEEDAYITGFRSIGPLGTHHTVLTSGSPTGPDGISDCSAGTNHTQMVFGSGVGDIEYHFPEGVGVKIAAGQQLLLNLHLFNLSDQPITGTSGTDAVFVSAADVDIEAESVLMGKVQLDIEPGVSTEVGQCTMERDVTLLTVAPHMHQLGTHMMVEAVRGGQTEVLLDEPYDFFDQKLYLTGGTAMSEGDRIRVSCTYDNTTGSTVNFGDSSTEEMCFAGMYRYPKRASSPTGIACLF